MEDFFAAGATLQVPFGVDFFAVAVGVITGAMFACDRKLDVVGTISLAIITAYGGGVIRDLLLQDKGIYFMQYPEVVLICMGIALFVFLFRGWFKHMGQALFFADALSVALFALAGANKAFQCDQNFLIIVMLGAITAVGGGALRDICVGHTPGIFLRSNYYAIAGIAGSLAFAILALVDVPLGIAALVCIFTVVFLRYLSVYFDWQTANDTDLAPKVNQGGRKVKEFAVELFHRADEHHLTTRKRHRHRSRRKK